MTTALLAQAAITMIFDQQATVGLPLPLVTGLPDSPARTCTWTPDLSGADQATLADVVAMTKSHITGLSLAEYQAIKPQLAEIRSFRTRSLAAWNALTTTQREADEIAYMNDLTDVLRAMLRDG